MTNNVYGIDLGTCNMKIYCKASNKIMNEKNTIALVNKNEMYAYGDDAYAMYEKAPETIQVTFPVVGGVIADFNAAEQMIRGMIKMANGKSKFFSPSLRIVVCIPSGSTEVELRAVRDSAEHAGGRDPAGGRLFQDLCRGYVLVRHFQ